MTNIRRFNLNVPDETLNHIDTRVSAYPWHEMAELDGWEHGANLDYMKEFCAYWVNEFDWRKHEARINRFPHYITEVDGLDLHFIHEKGSGTSPMPLIISHGWPGSVVEFLDLIEPLAHPERFGGNIDDAFDVVVPSLPGFGFSGKPPRPFGPRKMAGLFSKLEVRKLSGARWRLKNFCPGHPALMRNVFTTSHAGPSFPAADILQQWNSLNFCSMTSGNSPEQEYSPDNRGMKNTPPDKGGICPPDKGD